jgi:hypothetical protein
LPPWPKLPKNDTAERAPAVEEGLTGTSGVGEADIGTSVALDGTAGSSLRDSLPINNPVFVDTRNNAMPPLYENPGRNLPQAQWEVVRIVHRDLAKLVKEVRSDLQKMQAAAQDAWLLLHVPCVCCACMPCLCSDCPLDV